jgi:hypothetical protein
MTLVYIAVAVLALLYIGGPLLVKQQQAINARAPIVPIAIERMPEEVYALFGESAAEFQSLGFELIAYFTQPGMVGNVTPYVALWTNRGAGQSACATVIYTHAPNLPVQTKRYLEFSTKMAEGMAVMTNNATSLGSFKKVRTSDSLYAAQVQDAQQLYRLHLYRESVLTQPGAPRFLPAPGHELESFREGSEYVIRRQVGTGYYLDAGDGVYRMTFRGAFAMTWALLPPFKGLRAARERERVRKQLRESEQRPLAPTANVRISHESPYRDDPAISGL